MLTNRNNLNFISCEQIFFLVWAENNRSIEVKYTVHSVNTKSTSIWHNNKLYIKQNKIADCSGMFVTYAKKSLSRNEWITFAISF